MTTETQEVTLAPKTFLGNKIVNRDYISSIIGNFQGDIVIPKTNLRIGSTMTFSIEETYEAQVVVIGFSIKPFGVFLDIAMEVSGDIYVILEDVFYTNEHIIVTPTKQQETEE